MFRNIIRNWKTSGAGVIAGIVGLIIVFYPSGADMATKAGAAAGPFIAAIIGLFAKDGDKSGTAN